MNRRSSSRPQDRGGLNGSSSSWARQHACQLRWSLGGLEVPRGRAQHWRLDLAHRGRFQRVNAWGMHLAACHREIDLILAQAALTSGNPGPNIADDIQRLQKTVKLYPLNYIHMILAHFFDPFILCVYKLVTYMCYHM